MTTMRAALTEAMRLTDSSQAVDRLHESGVAIADEDTMSQAIHDVYCGIVADHQHPSEKDRQQARSLMEAMQRIASSQYPA